MMVPRKGFTLIELLVALIIIGVAVTFTIPSLISSFELSRAQNAKNNLIAISAAEQKYNEDYSVYCTATTGNVIPCGNSLSNINSNLRLSISDTFTYSCAVAGGSTPYNCTATDGTDTLTLNPNAVPPALPVTCAPVGSSCPFN